MMKKAIVGSQPDLVIIGGGISPTLRTGALGQNVELITIPQHNRRTIHL